MQTLNVIYLAYLDCLNHQAFDELGTFVGDNVEHTGRPFGLSGYRDMLVTDFADIPDLRFEAEILVSDATRIAARLPFDLHPQIHLHGSSGQWQARSVLRASVLRI